LNRVAFEKPEGYDEADYELLFRTIIPKNGECENLIVPWSLSASHMAFGSIRMEPDFMILSQSAATAKSWLSRRRNKPPIWNPTNWNTPGAPPATSTSHEDSGSNIHSRMAAPGRFFPTRRPRDSARIPETVVGLVITLGTIPQFAFCANFRIVMVGSHRSSKTLEGDRNLAF